MEAPSRDELGDGAFHTRDVQRLILQQCYRAGVGTAGSSLSIAAIVTALYGSILAALVPTAPDRDRVILSKGHAALAVYAALRLRGWLMDEELDTYCGDSALLGVHPDRGIPGIDFTTGSLGHGLPIACGAALGARLEGSTRRIFTLLSDGECNEGSVWEAAMFAAHHRLHALVAIIDVNGQQGFGFTRDVLSLAPFADKWRAFGWDVHEIDGRSAAAVVNVVEGLDTRSGPPHVLLARTTFGDGVSFMENDLDWHYAKLTREQFEEALSQVNAVK